MHPVRIVVADDHEAYCTALCECLTSFLDIDVVGVASNGNEALKLVEETHPDLLTLDLQMHPVDGWEVLSRLQEMPFNVRVLVHSAHSEPHYRERALDLGATAYVAKGDVRRLLDRIRQLIEVNLGR